MHKANLIGIHEAWIAHHVAAVGEVDGQHRAAAMLDGRGPVIVQLVVVMRADVTPGEDFFEMAEELSIHGHYVFEMAMFRTILHHQDLAVALDNLRLDLADLLVQQDLMRQLPIDDLLTDLRNALGTKGVGGAWPA